MEVSLGYTFDEDGLIRLQKDLNHLLTNLNDQNVKSIRTEYCVVEAKGHETVLDGSLLEMYDFNPLTSQATTTIRLRAGYNKLTSNFEFSLWNSISTTPTISLDSVGNGVFSGSINTSESMYIGNNIFLGQTGSTITKGMYFNATTPTSNESEGTSDMKSAIYTDVLGPYFAMNLNSTGLIDIIAYQGIFLGRNTDTNNSTYTGIEVTTSNFNINYFPHTILGDEMRHNVWLGDHINAGVWNSSNVVASQGYVDVSNTWDMESYLKSMWAEQGKMIEEFGSTASWVPNALCRVETAGSSANKRIFGSGLTIYNQTTASGDITVYKNYTDMDLSQCNDSRALTTDASWYLLFYLYDLSKINILSTKAMQLEIASSSSLGDKLRWLIGGSTTASTLTTGWNLVTRRLSYGYYYAGTFNPTIFKYARFSFEVPVNSSGRVATLQSFGIVRPTTDGSTSCNMFPRYDDLHGGYRLGMLTTYQKLLWGIHRPTSTGIVMYNLGGLCNPAESAIYPNFGYSFNNEHLIKRFYNGDSKLEYTVRCKNDRGCLPYMGGVVAKTFYDSTGKYGVWATSHIVYLDCEMNSTILTDGIGLFNITYDSEYKITLWKEDPPIYNCTHNDTQIIALIEHIGTSEAAALSYNLPNARWKQEAFTPIIASCEADVGAEILNIKYGRR
jgi:hypothetical protein